MLELKVNARISAFPFNLTNILVLCLVKMKIKELQGWGASLTSFEPEFFLSLINFHFFIKMEKNVV